MNSNNTKGLAVSAPNTCLANLQIRPHLSLGAGSSGGVINVTATAFALGLPAHCDLDDLLQNGRADEV